MSECVRVVKVDCSDFADLTCAKVFSLRYVFFFSSMYFISKRNFNVDEGEYTLTPHLHYYDGGYQGYMHIKPTNQSS